MITFILTIYFGKVYPPEWGRLWPLITAETALEVFGLLLHLAQATK